YMTCGVQPDLTAACWGDNVSEGPGQSTPPAGVRFLEVNAGYNTGCGITVTRSIVCWGNNSFGKVTDVPAGTFLHVAPGFNFVCALRTDGTPVCWGQNDAFQITRVPTTEVFTQLTVGIRHACGLRPDGTVLCWGANADGQLNVPQGTFTAINSGNFTVCGIRPDLSVVCWGRNQGGQLNEPPGPFVQVSAGFAHVCGLRPDRTITCWGRNAEGQTNAPPGRYINVSAGTFHSCAMPVSGPPAVCWGNNAAGRVQPSLSRTPPPAGRVGTPYSFQFTMATVLNPAPTFRVVSGAPPPGLTLSPQGRLSGTPTTAGTYTVTVAAANALSPPDCPAGARGDLACIPGDNQSTATATRTFQIVIAGASGGTPTTQPGPTTTTTSPRAPSDQCAALVQQRQAFNASTGALVAQLRSGGAFLQPLVASVERSRAQENARYDQRLADAGCEVAST
ncbi:MAG: hypothetical protein LC708_00510, partial [Actinobacteria bacterium]|nr:hypothetical protein [Actinomycetota bacterium]